MDRPPNRQSVDDPDFDPSVGARTLIYLDGTLQKEASAYDCDAGTVTRPVVDAEGRLQLTPSRDAILQEVVTGTVTVEWKADKA